MRSVSVPASAGRAALVPADGAACFPLSSKNGREMGRKKKKGSSALWGRANTDAEGFPLGDDATLVETGVNWGVKQWGNRRSGR